MGDTVQNVRIKFTSDTAGLTTANKELAGLTKAEADAVRGFRAINDSAVAANKTIQNESKKSQAELKKTKESAGFLEDKFKSIGTSIVAAFSVGAILSFGKGVLDVTSQFEKLRAVLSNTLGSVTLADAALAKITKVAATTNFGVLELTNAYVKLTNQGFQPTEKELIKLADIANSTGKSFDQLAEAILDAGTFQFERLKEFGIKASQEGDRIKFTFKGVTTEVAKTSTAVQQYILSLGELNGVAGSTAAISQTVEGRVSNLGDAVDGLYNTLGSAKSGVFKSFVEGLTTFVNALAEGARTAEQLQAVLIGLNADSQYNQLIARYNADFNKYSAAIGDNKELLTQYYNIQITGLEQARGANQEELRILEERKAAQEALRKSLDPGLFGKKLKEGEVSATQTAAAIKVTEQEIIKLTGTINAQERVIAEFQGKITQAERAAAEAAEAEKKRLEDAAKEREKQFKATLDLLAQQEKLAIARARFEDKSASDILKIENSFNEKRIDIFQDFGKTRTEDYKFLILKTEELEKDLTKFYTEEEEKRAKARLELRDQQLKNIDDDLKSQKNAQSVANNALIEEQRNLYTSGTVNKEQFEEKIKEIDYNSKRDQIQSAIQADEEKLTVSKLSSEQRESIEADLNNRIKELDDLEFQNFQDKEDKKVVKTKERAEEIKKIEKAAFDTAVSIVDSLYQIGQNNRDAELQGLQAQKAAELEAVGDNKQKQAVINEKFAQKELELKRKQAQADKDQATFNAIINGAVGVTQAFASSPPPYSFVLAALVAAATGLQIAAIQSKPLPKFFEGTEYVGLNGNKPGRDTIPAMLHEGERVVPTSINKSLTGIPNSELPNLAKLYRGLDYEGIQRDLYSGKSGGSQEVVNELKSVGKKLDNLKVANIAFDKNGFKTYITTKNSEVEFVNNYFRS